MKGSYVLLIELKKNKQIIIGKQGEFFFKKGFYVYVGSALNGVEHRIQRHLRKQKKKHWHIDYLLTKSTIRYVFVQEKSSRQECYLAHHFEKKCQSIPSFGCSDCSCTSHLFTSSLKQLGSLIESLKMDKYYENTKS